MMWSCLRSVRRTVNTLLQFLPPTKSRFSPAGSLQLLLITVSVWSHVLKSCDRQRWCSAWRRLLRAVIVSSFVRLGAHAGRKGDGSVITCEEECGSCRDPSCSTSTFYGQSLAVPGVHEAGWRRVEQSAAPADRGIKIAAAVGAGKKFSCSQSSLNFNIGQPEWLQTKISFTEKCFVENRWAHPLFAGTIIK